MEEDEFREAIIGYMALMTSTLEKISEHLDYIGTRLNAIHTQLVRQPALEEQRSKSLGRGTAAK